MIKVELSDPSQISGLLDAAAYEAFIAEGNRKVSATSARG